MLLHKFLRRDPEACIVRQDFFKLRRLFQRFAVDAHGLRIGLHFVFDGEECPNKAREATARSQRRDAALAEYIRTGDESELQKACRVTPELRRACMEALHEIGAQYTMAPYEADSQLAWMFDQGSIAAVLADDGDFLCMGCVVVRDFNLFQGTAVEYDPSRLTDCSGCDDPLLKQALKHGLCATLQIFACYVGNDYSNVPKVGPVRAIQLIEQHGVDAASHSELLDDVTAQHFRDALLAYNHSLVYDSHSRTVLSKSCRELSEAEYTVVGQVRQQDCEHNELHSRGVILHGGAWGIQL
eukprot:TRINITY_DN50038_c0_g1_i1.p1 TRINITY_DN50038_c0_g1~~TRINITY_DN50038_c0_g1_i1.p1  ORF type:complete len:298 (-),score=68.19 TRINITY_DN50038_c0_g1_i1:110-1003(-)